MKQSNANKKVKHLLPFLEEKGTLLDFGCGDMSFAKALKAAKPALSVSGVDVVDFNVRFPGVTFVSYDGKTLPWKNRSIDAVVSWHVLHHTDRPFHYLHECLRVARKRFYLVEPVYRHPWEIPGMKLMDWVFNAWKGQSVPMPFTFASKKRWLREIQKAKWECERIVDVELLPPFLPTGRSLLFVCSPASSFVRHKKHAS